MRRPLLLALALSALPIAHAAPTVSTTGDTATLRHAGQELAVSLTDAVMTFRGPGVEFTLTPNLQQDTGWTQPVRCAGQTVRREAGAVVLELTYPVPGNRQFTVQASAHPDLAAIFVTARLRVLGASQAQYYYLQTSLGGDHYFAPRKGRPERIACKTDAWDAMPRLVGTTSPDGRLTGAGVRSRLVASFTGVADPTERHECR